MELTSINEGYVTVLCHNRKEMPNGFCICSASATRGRRLNGFLGLSLDDRSILNNPSDLIG